MIQTNATIIYRSMLRANACCLCGTRAPTITLSSAIRRALSVSSRMWERFTTTGMRALLILFRTAPAAAGGLGFDTGVAGADLRLYTSRVVS